MGRKTGFPWGDWLVKVIVTGACYGGAYAVLPPHHSPLWFTAGIVAAISAGIAYGWGYSKGRERD